MENIFEKISQKISIIRDKELEAWLQVVEKDLTQYNDAVDNAKDIKSLCNIRENVANYIQSITNDPRFGRLNAEQMQNFQDVVDGFKEFVTLK